MGTPKIRGVAFDCFGTLLRVAMTYLTDTEARAAARAVVKLFRLCGLSDPEARDMLGGLSEHSWCQWKAGEIGNISRDLGTRLSLFIGIHVSLRHIFGADRVRAYGWMRCENAVFGGRSAVDVILNGQMLDLWQVRRYLETQRVGDVPLHRQSVPFSSKTAAISRCGTAPSAANEVTCAVLPGPIPAGMP